MNCGTSGCFAPIYAKELCYNHYVSTRRFKLKLDVLKFYSRDLKCSCCGEDNFMLLTIDHINNDGHKRTKQERFDSYTHIMKNHYPDGLQVLCYNCNIGRDRNGGVCPHKKQHPIVKTLLER